MKYRITNGKLFQEEGDFISSDLYIQNEQIITGEAYESLHEEECILDASDAFVIPGLTDIHFHGCVGADCCDGTPEALAAICRHELTEGVMQVTPATMTIGEDQLTVISRAAKDFHCPDGADFCGLYMEGPFISPAKKGAQNEKYVHTPDSAMLQRLQEASGNAFRSVIIAPEVPGALDFIRENQEKINISIGHTSTDYDMAKEALSLGASQLTHMFNAMPGLTHRAPGPIAAAVEDEKCMAELICDGVHIHPSMVRLAFRLFGDHRIIMISDSLRAAGMPDGSYELGGQTFHVNGPLATLEDGTIAGSVSSLMGCLRTAVQKMGIPLHSAVRAASLNPARAVGIDSEYGSLTPGKIANIVLLNQDLSIRRLIHRGEVL